RAGSRDWAQFTADGRTLLTANEYKAVLWNFRTRLLERYLEHRQLCSRLRGVALSPDGRRLVSTHADGGLRLWDVANWQGHFPCGVPLGAVQSLAVSPAGRARGRGPRLPELTARLHQWLGVPGLRRETKFGGIPLGHAADGVLQWEGPGGQPLPPLPSAAALPPPERVVLSPDGRLLAAGGPDGSVWVW